MRRLVILLLALVGIMPAAAQDAVRSPGPQYVAVTVYRAPYRSPGQPMFRNFLQGYALITETRRVRLPAGRAVIRFEGVAGGIFPETAIVSGLPSGVREKNLDADLLSPRSLYDRSLGRRVMIQRTDRKTGKRVTEQAIIRSGAAGAAVLQTADGIETLRCDDWPETIAYDRVPPGLTPKPTLSVETESPATREVVLTLSYLAGGFDWNADYVLTLAPDGGGAQLFAWVTLASSDVTSFANARTQVVAGRLERTSDAPPMRRGGGFRVQCWPRPDYASHESADAIVVTGSRIRARSLAYAVSMPPAPAPPPPPPPPPMASQEELGDLKLYRLPLPVTVAAKAEKQVAMLAKPAVTLAMVYVSDIFGDYLDGAVPTLRTANNAANGLGLPLPAGRAAVFQGGDIRPIMIGTATVGDKAVGEDVAFKLDAGPAVQAQLTQLSTGPHARRYRLVCTNVHPWPVDYEANIRAAPGQHVSAGGRELSKHDGVPQWRTIVPANGSAALDYDVGGD